MPTRKTMKRKSPSRGRKGGVASKPGSMKSRPKRTMSRRGRKGGVALAVHQPMPIERMRQAAVRTVKGTNGSTALMAAAGAVVGATLGGLAGVALSDEKTRKMVGERLSDMAKNAQDNMYKLNDKAQKMKESTDEVASTAKNVKEKFEK